MFSSVRANFQPPSLASFIAHFHALSLRFSSSHRSSGYFVASLRDHTAKVPATIVE